MKTVTELRRGVVHDTIITVYFVLNSLLDWEPVERLKLRNDVVSFTCVFFYFQYEASGIVLYEMMAMDRGSRQARKERIAVVEA